MRVKLENERLREGRSSPVPEKNPYAKAAYAPRSDEEGSSSFMTYQQTADSP